MKNYLFIFILFLVMLIKSNNLFSQIWEEDKFYAKEGITSVECGLWQSVCMGFDSLNHPIYKYFRECKVEVWDKWYGKKYGYFWHCSMFDNCFWVYLEDTRYWYFFKWKYYKEWYKK